MQVDRTYSVVVPVYNSGGWLEELVERIGAVMERDFPGDFELLLVNDASPDPGTWPAVQACAARYPWVRGFNLLYNVGQFRALLCGLEQARGELLVTMDDDLQHLPEEIPVLIGALSENPSVQCVMGEYRAKRHALHRKLGSRLYQKTLHVLYGKPAHLQTTSFRVLRRPLAEALVVYRSSRPLISAMVVKLTRDIANVDIDHASRENGKSGYRLKNLMGLTLDSIVYATTVPLRLFSAFGLLFALGSMGLGSFYLVRKLTGGIGVEGFTTQILLIIFFGGMSLAGIGLLGEYVARIISEITGPERYRVLETTSGTSEDKPETRT